MIWLSSFTLCVRQQSLVCFGLLLRNHRRERSSLAFKCSLAFLCFAISNLLLFIDLIVLPQVDLRMWRNVFTLVGVVVLVLAVTQDHQGNRRE